MWPILILGFLAVTSGHIVNRVQIKKLQNQVNDLQAEQETIFDILSTLETNLTAQIAEAKGKSFGGGTVTSTGTQVVDISESLESRLKEMEDKVSN